MGRVGPEIHPRDGFSSSKLRQYWLGVGAKPSDAVAKLLRITGDWQTFKGTDGTEGSLKVAEPKRTKQEIFNEALKDSSHEPATEAVTKKLSLIHI